MAILRDFNHFLSVFFDTLRAVRKGRVWLILLGYAAVSALGLVALYRCFTPLTFPLSSVLVTWASYIGGWGRDLFYQYPGQFLVLPIAHSWFKVAVAISAEGLVLGAVAIRFHRHYSGDNAEKSNSSVLWSSWGNFVLASLALNVLLILLSFAPSLFQSMLAGNPRRQLIYEMVTLPLITGLLQALFFFVIPAIALYRESFVSALVRSLRIFVHRPLTCFFLAMIALVLPTVIGFAANHADIIIDKFRPELVFWVVLLGVTADMIFNFFWIGTAVRFLEDDTD